MGMYDNMRVDVPLPDGWIPDELQTKDFDCEMVTHAISASGRLMLDRGHWEEVPLAERPMWNAAWGDSDAARKEHSLEAICGSVRRVSKMEDAEFHGVVNFGGLEVLRRVPDEGYGSRGRPVYKRHDYYAKFTDGQLVEITVETD